MKLIPWYLKTIAVVCFCFAQVTNPATIIIRLVSEDAQAHFLYAIGSMDENRCDFPDPTKLMYRNVGGAQGSLIAFDNTLINWLFVKESADSKPYPLYGFNLKNTQTFQLGGVNVIVIRRDGTIGYDRLDDL